MSEEEKLESFVPSKEELEDEFPDHIDVDPDEGPAIEKMLVIAKDPSIDDGIGFQVIGMDMDEALILLMHGSSKFEKQYEKWLRDRY